MKKLKQLSIYILSIIILLSIMTGIGITVNADTSGDFKYAVSVLNDGTAEITEYNGTASVLTIPSDINGYTVKSIGFDAFYNCTNLTKITIPDSVTEIHGRAFKYTGLTSVTIPDSVTSIGYSAFEHTPLISVILSNNLEMISDYTFAYCANLVSITIPYNAERINSGAFYECTSLNSIVILREDCVITDDEETISATAAIYGYTGSTAQEYAEKYGRTFIALDNNPIITDGTDTEYTIGSEKGATIHCAYDLADFINASVNGEVVDESDYILEKGSTILTFLPSYLDTLSPGEYEVLLTYVNGTATVTLTVLDNTDSDESADAENNMSENAENEASQNKAQGTASSELSKKSPSTGMQTASIAFAVALVSGSIAVIIRRKREEN